jgi:hypothetical protein
MACFFAIRSGLNDAKQGNPPDFWSLLWDREQRLYMVKEGWKNIGRVFLLALARVQVQALEEPHESC